METPASELNSKLLICLLYISDLSCWTDLSFLAVWFLSLFLSAAATLYVGIVHNTHCREGHCQEKHTKKTFFFKSDLYFEEGTSYRGSLVVNKQIFVVDASFSERLL